MNQLIDFLTSNTTLAYITALAIFIITVIMLMRRIIGVIVTIVLLLFALLSGLAIANHDLFREILTGFKYEPEKTKEDTYTHYKNQLNKTFEELKEEFEIQKKRVEALYDAYQKTPEKEPTNTPQN